MHFPTPNLEEVASVRDHARIGAIGANDIRHLV
jgi:hypothetical protein